MPTELEPADEAVFDLRCCTATSPRPGDDLGWSGGEGPDSSPSDELFQWWSDRVAATGLALYGRRLWETMSPHWPTADQQPGATIGS